MSAGRQALDDLLELTPDAMLIVDAAGTVVHANRLVTALFGGRREEIVDRSVAYILSETPATRDGTGPSASAATRWTRSVGPCLQLHGRRADGGVFPAEVSLSPLRDGLIAAAIRDATNRQLAESELIAARESANRAREEADRANVAKSRFLATASHDLRQPLQSLTLLNGALRRMCPDAIVRDAVAQQAQAIEAMKRLLNALLDIGKLESGAVKAQPVDFQLAPLFDRLCGEFATIAAEKGLELQVERPAQCVYSDPALVEQALGNFVSNAIKYTRTGSVRLSALQRDDLVRIEVSDTGIGIAADQLPFIFDEFFQVVAAKATREGYGLGLSIVQRIANLLGATMDVQSQPWVGSIFAIEIPTARERPASRIAPAMGPDVNGRAEPAARILLVDDDRQVLSAMQLLLGVEGYHVAIATACAEAMQRAREDGNLDLIITDYHLNAPETGLDVITSLRTMLGRDIPAVLMTGDTSPAIMRLPHDERLRLARKPIDTEELIGFIDDLLE
jgi:PAS domain S-box-containing protein